MGGKGSRVEDSHDPRASLVLCCIPQGPRSRSAAPLFVEAWSKRLADIDPATLPDDLEMPGLIETRERRLKGPRARLHNHGPVARLERPRRCRANGLQVASGSPDASRLAAGNRGLMLSPDSRTVAFDLLRPPAGHELDFALLTTYTLNLETMLALPLSLVARADNSLEELLADPLLLLEAPAPGGRTNSRLRGPGRHRRPPPETRSSTPCWNRACIPCARRGGGAFHPKVWVLRFKSDDGEPLIRVAILSRNLTFDRSWDIALASEAAPRPRQRTAGSRPLAEFIRRLPELCAEGPAPSLSDRMEALADEVSRTRFPAPEGFSDDLVRFHVLGMDGRHARGRLWRPMSDGYDVLAVAPFVGSTALNEVARMGSGEAHSGELPGPAGRVVR